MPLQADMQWGKGRRMSSEKGVFELGSVASNANATVTLHTTVPFMRWVSFVKCLAQSDSGERSKCK